MKAINKLTAITIIILLTAIGCREGEDASLFNGVNELEITGTISIAPLDFDHMTVPMKVHLFTSENFQSVPSKRLTLNWYRRDDQGNNVAVNEANTTFYNGVSVGDYYAVAFIDLNRNSEVDANEPYDIWTESNGDPKIIRVREESRWEIDFLFSSYYSDF